MHNLVKLLTIDKLLDKNTGKFVPSEIAPIANTKTHNIVNDTAYKPKKL